ncbi:uncharacterized protein BO72DRAFT_390486 [Aspergillus fijiensis CBS 313.89]|uniref:Uncharacterized protein n=1 Tax=Aspergillus fijiensis CBS 313.89 TaxID=1448319 RepID=A0A8G1REW4_9EURO|nr:uncharacterized protein BO72DRAFT_390486 [Aspergillus fijiensis CBS 313.89]RAK72020.1 hypothetical protein BO72DRAFT_390486 [Aspergillus fijiensis CBS 313.89]
MPPTPRPPNPAPNPANPNPNIPPQPAPTTKPLTPLRITTPEDQCTTLHGITYTFYGYPDNDPPGAAIAYECPHRSGSGTAGGTGTYDDPLTFATAPGEFELCEVIYSPYLQKYLIHEDYCESCTRHWPHMWHVDVWLGGDSVGAAAEQLSCEARLTPELESQSVVRGPRGDLPVDGTTFYAGGHSACGVEHVYHAAGAEDYC